MSKIDKRQTPREAPPPVAGHALRILVLWALVFASYSNSFQAGLIFDNDGLLAQDPRIREATHQNLRSIATGGYWYVNANTGLYRPLTTLSYLLNYAVLGDGLRPAGYHRVNLALHEVNVALLYALGLLIFGAPAPALALGAIWGLHPVLTESVTNIAGRADLLAACAVLAGLLCYARSAAAAGWRRIVWLTALVAAQTLGLLSKESAAVLPGILLLYDLSCPEAVNWRRRAPAYAALALPFALWLYLRSGLPAMAIPFADNPLVAAGFWTARLTAIQVIGKLLWLFVWPSRLSVDYTYNAIPLSGWGAFAALAACLGLILLAVRLRRPFLFFLGFFFVALAPSSNLVVLIGSMMAERFLYLPAIGLAGCVVAAVLAYGRRRSIEPAWAAVGLVCLAFAVRIHARNLDWLDERTLWTSAVKATPGSARAHYNLGTALAPIPGRLEEAIAEYQAALRIRADYAEAHNNLANALARTPGGLPEAVDEYRAALRSDPGLAEAHYSLGNALAHMPGRLPEAIAEYEAALRIRPDYVNAHMNLGNALARTPGRLLDAMGQYQAALRISPDYADAHNNLGNVLAELPGRLPEAIAEYQAALRIDPDHARAHANLGDALAQIPGRLPEAIAEYEAALRITPDPQLKQLVDRLRCGAGCQPARDR